ASAVTGLVGAPTASAPVAVPVAQPTTASPPAPAGGDPELLPVPEPVKKPAPAWRRRLPLVAGGAALMVGTVVLLIVLLSGGKKTEKESGDDTERAGRKEEDRELGTEELVARCKPGVALLRGSAGFGTGFLAQPKLLVTNAHVVEMELLDKVRIQ